MTKDISLAEQIGTLDEAIDDAVATAAKFKHGKEGYRQEMRVVSLTATRAVLTYLMNNEAEFKAFMAGRKGK